MIQINILKKATLAILLGSMFFLSKGQGRGYTEFFRESMETNTTGMYVLGSWAVANIIIGGAGWHKNSGTLKYFHQMNLFWNTVNLSVAGVALYTNFSDGINDLTSEMMMHKHYKIEKLYLINGALDLVYIGTGFLLKNLSLKNEKNIDILKGYGNSVILQGSFLLLFDTVMWAVQRNHRLQFLDHVYLSFSSANICYEVVLKLSF